MTISSPLYLYLALCSSFRSLLVPSETHNLDHLSPETDRWLSKAVLVSLNLGSLPDQVNLVGLDITRALKDLPSRIKKNSKDLHGVVLEKHLDVKLGSEGVVSVCEEDDKLDDYSDVGSVRLEVSVVRSLRLSVDALGNTSLVVVDVGDGHDNEGDQTTTGDDADEPAQNLGRVAADLEEREEGEAHDDDEAVYGNTGLVAVSEESRGTAFKSQRVEGSSGTVGVGVSGGEDRGEDQEVDQVRQALDAKVGHGNNIGRRSRVTRATGSEVDLDEGRVVVGANDTDGQGTNDEEDAESVVHGLEGRLDVVGRALGLGRDHGDVLGTDDGEGSAPEGGEETFEPAFVASA